MLYPTDHEAQDSNGSSISESKEEATEKKESPLAVNKGSAHVNLAAALREDLRENVTNETEKPDRDLKTTASQSNVSGKFCSCEIGHN